MEKFNELPLEIIKNILSYNINFVIRKGEIIQINKIYANDERYQILRNIPEKKYTKMLGGGYYVNIDINDNKCIYIAYLTDYEYLQILVRGYDMFWSGTTKIININI